MFHGQSKGHVKKTITDNVNIATGARWKLWTESTVSSQDKLSPAYNRKTLLKVKEGISSLQWWSCSTTHHAPKEFWCFCASFLDKVRCNKNAHTALEATYSHTNNISKFRFPWFSSVWYSTAFPEDKMSPGFFLYIAEYTGDTFLYVILPGKDYNSANTIIITSTHR